MIDPEVMRRLDQQASLIRQLQGSAASGARVYNSANISVSHNDSSAPLTFDSERFDTGDFHSTSSNTGRLTAPTAGLYLMGACVQFAANATGLRALLLRLNGSTFIVRELIDIDSATTHGLAVSTTYQLAAGDYVEAIAFQTSGGALNVEAGANYSPEFWINHLGPAPA